MHWRPAPGAAGPTARMAAGAVRCSLARTRRRPAPRRRPARTQRGAPSPRPHSTQARFQRLRQRTCPLRNAEYHERDWRSKLDAIRRAACTRKTLAMAEPGLDRTKLGEAEPADALA